MKKFIIGGSILMAVVIICALIPTQNPKMVNVDHKFLPMSSAHLLGTDDLGRDIFALMVVGFNRTITVLISACLTSVIVGCAIGTISGYFGGNIRILVRLFADISMVVPSLIVALIVIMTVGNSPFAVGMALGIYGIGTFAYQSENLTRKMLDEEFIIAEKLLGTPTHKILFNHILRNNLPPIMAVLSSQGGNIILAYASLTFIGLGSDITTPDWGSMLYQYRFYIVEKPVLILWPTLGILSLSLFMYYMFDDWKDKKYK